MYAIYCDGYGMQKDRYYSLEEAKQNCTGDAGTIYELKPILGYEECYAYDFYEMKQQ